MSEFKKNFSSFFSQNKDSVSILFLFLAIELILNLQQPL